MIRDGLYDISLNLDNVVYLSSAGIRILISQYKNLKKLGGSFYLSSLSDNVEKILEMVGMAEMLTEKPEKIEPVEEKTDKSLQKHDFRFQKTVIDTKNSMKIKTIGNPELTKTATFKKEDNINISFEKNKYALGIGAFGENFEDCRSRYGEYISLGDAVAYMPTDSSKIPDYEIKTGKLIPEINSLYTLMAEGDFSCMLNFEPMKAKKSIILSDIVDSIFEMNKTDHAAILMVAESDGLVGVSLSKSPVDEKALFQFPEIKDNVNFTTEPTHTKMLTISFGYFTKNPEGQMIKFLRPLKPGSDISGHMHSAIFPFQPIKKNNIDFNEIIHSVFENSVIEDILHLTNDHREINGLGESRFKHGYCWIGKQ